MKYVAECEFNLVLDTLKDVFDGKKPIQWLKRMSDYYEKHPIEVTEFVKKDFKVTGYEKK